MFSNSWLLLCFSLFLYLFYMIRWLNRSHLLNLWFCLQVSFFSTSPELSNKQRFEYFSRTIPSDHYQVKAMVEIVRRLGWSYISIIYEESNYGIKVSLQFFFLFTDNNIFAFIMRPVYICFCYFNSIHIYIVVVFACGAFLPNSRDKIYYIFLVVCVRKQSWLICCYVRWNLLVQNRTGYSLFIAMEHTWKLYISHSIAASHQLYWIVFIVVLFVYAISCVGSENWPADKKLTHS